MKFNMFFPVRQTTVIFKITVVLAALLFLNSPTHAQTDPTLLWGTYFGGDSTTYGSNIARDSSGNVYITGQTFSTIGIATKGAYQTLGDTNGNVFLAKFNSLGSLLWATYYGGDGYDYGYGIAIDKSGNIYISGNTYSDTGIATSGAYRTKISSTYYGNCFLAKFNSNGSLLWGTYFGGSDNGSAPSVTIDKFSNIYLSGTTHSTSGSGIATKGAYQTKCDSIGGNIFLAKFNSSGSLLWGTFYGDSDEESGITINDTNIYITGYAGSGYGIATKGAYQTSWGGSFLANFNATGNLHWATYYGGEYNYGNGITTDFFDNIYITGTINIYSKRIATSGAYQTSFGGGVSNAYIAKFNSKGSLLWGTYFGGNGEDEGIGLALGTLGNVYLCGSTTSTFGIATSGAYQTSYAGGFYWGDVYLAKFSSSGTLLWATYYGGKWDDGASDLATDASNLYIGGSTVSNSGIATPGAYQDSISGMYYFAFLAKFHDHIYKNNAGIYRIISPTKSICADSMPVIVKLLNYGSDTLKSVKIGWTVNGVNQITYKWTGNLNADSATIINLGNYYFTPGTYTIRAWTYLPNGVTDSFPWNDTAKILDTVFAKPKANAGGNNTICSGASITIGSNTESGVTYQWKSKPAGFTSTNANVSVAPTITTTYYLKSIASCSSDSDSVVITVNPLPLANAGTSKAICYGDSATIGGTPVSGDSYNWVSNPVGFTSTRATGMVAPTATTTYILIEIITATGCTKSDSVSITVYPYPTPNAGSPETICFGATGTIGGPAVTGYSYSWTSNPAGFGSTMAEASPAPTVSATYYLTVKNMGGCAATDSVAINVLPAFVPDSFDQVICAGINSLIGAAPIANCKYAWYDVSHDSVLYSYSSNPRLKTKYGNDFSVLITDTLTGCSGSEFVEITTVPDVGTPYAGKDTTICKGGGVQLGSLNSSGASYAWTSKPPGFSSSSYLPYVNPTVTTTYYVTASNSGCSAMDSVTITVKTIPVANAGGGKQICLGDTTQIGDSAAAGVFYLWMSSPGGFSSILSNPSVSPTTITTYYVKASNMCGSSNDFTLVKVNPLPFDEAGLNSTICDGDSAKIGSTAVNGYTFSWVSAPSGFTSTRAAGMVAPTATTTYILIETITATGCKNADTVIITVNPLPITPTITSSGDTLASSAKTGNQWLRNDTVINGASSQKYIALINGIYSVVVTDSNSCSAASKPLNYTMTGINEPNGNLQLKIYPNPFTAQTTIEATVNKNTPVSLAIYDMTGRQITDEVLRSATFLKSGTSNVLSQFTYTFDAKKYGCGSGVYIVKLAIGDAVVQQKIVLIR